MIATVFRLLQAMSLIVLLAGPSFADDDGLDHEAARRLVESGQIRALPTIVEEIRPKVAGDILSVSLEARDHGGYKYDLKVLSPEGKVQEVEVDASTGAILSIEDDD